MASRVIELKEEQVSRFARATLPDSDIISLNETGKFEIEPASLLNSYTYGIKSRGWIGHIPVGEHLLVRVLPKIAVNNLFRMLEVAYNLRSFRLLEGEINIEQIEDLYERIVSILARRILDRARKGLYCGYVGHDEQLPYLRGHVDVVATMLNVLQGIPRLPCSYEEHTADVDDNRILLWTLRQVRRQTLKQTKVRRELDAARRVLDGVITLERRSAADCVARLYNRLNDDYGPMHGLCRFILEQSGPGFLSGDRTFVPFVLNMPQLFESFVAEWLRQNPPHGVTLRVQHTALLDATLRLKIRVDIVVIDQKKNRVIAILDTKYKRDEQPSEADIYQIAFYAGELQAERAILVYPSSAACQFKLSHGKIRVESLAFDISGSLNEAGAAFLNELSRRLGLALA